MNIEERPEWEQWQVQVIEKVSPPGEEEQAEAVKWSRKKKLLVLFLFVFAIGAAIAGMYIYTVQRETEEEQKSLEYFERLMKAKRYWTILETYIENEAISEEDKKKYTDAIEKKSEELCEQYNQNPLDEKMSLDLEMFIGVFDVGEEEYERLRNSKMNYMWGESKYNDGQYLGAYDLLRMVAENDTNYEQAQKYIRQIEGRGRKQTEITVWYTTEFEGNLAKCGEKLLLEKNPDIEKFYSLRFKNVQMSGADMKKELEQEEGERPDLIFSEELRGLWDMPQEDRYYSFREWGTAMPVLLYNKKLISEDSRLWEIMDSSHAQGNMGDFLNEKKEGALANIYLPLESAEGLEMFLKATGYFSMYPEEVEYLFNDDLTGGARQDYGDKYISNLREARMIDVLDYVRVLAASEMVYTGADGPELFRQGKIAAAVVEPQDCREMIRALGEENISASPMPMFSVADGLSYNLAGLEKSYYLGIIQGDVGYGSKGELLEYFAEQMESSDMRRYLEENYDMRVQLWGVEEDSGEKENIFLKAQKQSEYYAQSRVEEGECYYVDLKSENEIRRKMGQLARDILQMGSRREIQNYVYSLDWISPSI